MFGLFIIVLAYAIILIWLPIHVGAIRRNIEQIAWLLEEIHEEQTSREPTRSSEVEI
jgi:hypothetical protein